MNATPQTLPCTGFVRKTVVLAHVPFGATKLYMEVKAGRFPAPIKLGPRIVAWRVEDVRQWIEQKSTQARGEA